MEDKNYELDKETLQLNEDLMDDNYDWSPEELENSLYDLQSV